MNKTEQHKKALLKALEKSLGVVTTACKQVGVGRTTFYEWYNKDEEFKNQVDDISNIALDFAESQLHKQIQEGNTTATIFLLKTKGKKRGYVERQEIQHDGTVQSTLIEWKPPQEEKSSKNVTDSSTILSNPKKDSKSTKEEQDQAKQ